MAEVHALRQAAHVKVGAAAIVPERRTFSADDRGGVPRRLNAPAVQDGAILRQIGLGSDLEHIVASRTELQARPVPMSNAVRSPLHFYSRSATLLSKPKGEPECPSHRRSIYPREPSIS